MNILIIGHASLSQREMIQQIVKGTDTEVVFLTRDDITPFPEEIGPISWFIDPCDEISPEQINMDFTIPSLTTTNSRFMRWPWSGRCRGKLLR